MEDYEIQLNCLGEAIEQLNTTLNPVVGNTLNKIRVGYEELISAMYENQVN